MQQASLITVLAKRPLSQNPSKYPGSIDFDSMLPVAQLWIISTSQNSILSGGFTHFPTCLCGCSQRTHSSQSFSLHLTGFSCRGSQPRDLWRLQVCNTSQFDTTWNSHREVPFAKVRTNVLVAPTSICQSDLLSSSSANGWHSMGAKSSGIFSWPVWGNYICSVSILGLGFCMKHRTRVMCLTAPPSICSLCQTCFDCGHSYTCALVAAGVFLFVFFLVFLLVALVVFIVHCFCSCCVFFVVLFGSSCSFVFPFFFWFFSLLFWFFVLVFGLRFMCLMSV